jgi:hypothetical protein
VDRLLVSGALLLLILEIGALFGGLDDAPKWMRGSPHAFIAKSIGHLSRTENQVRRRPRNSLVWNESQKTETVYEYDSVLTLGGSSAQIQLQDQTRLNLDENTLVVLEPNTDQASGSLRIRFSHGSLRSKNTDTNLSIESGTFTLAAEKGSELSLVSLNDGRVSLELQGGRATFKNGEGAQEIQNGEKLILRDDKIEEKKKISENLRFSEELPTRLYSQTFPIEYDLKWSGAATSLRLTDASRKERVISLGKDSSKRVALEEGQNFFSLQSHDAESSTFAIQVRRAPFTRYLSPLPRDRVRLGTEQIFAWEAMPGIEHYRLEIAKNVLFVGAVESFDVAEPRTKIPLKAEGQFFWRVIGVDPEKFSVPAAVVYPLFVAPDPLASPELKTPEIQTPVRLPAREGASLLWKLLLPRAFAAEKKLAHLDAAFNWSPVSGADHYVIEISRTPGFEETVVNQRVSKPSFLWKSLTPGVYFWRVAAGADGRLGLFSPLAVAKLESHETFAGTGVVVQAPVVKKAETVTVPEKLPGPPVELGVDTSGPLPAPTPEARSTPTPTPLPTPEPDVPMVARDSGVSGRAAWRPHLRSSDLRGEESIAAAFNGWVPLSIELEFNFLTAANNLIEWRASFDQTQWSAKDADLQGELSDSRMQTDLYYRPRLGRWAYGLGVETLSFLKREGPEKAALTSKILYGPQIRYSQTVGGSRELDLQFKVRAGDGVLGARAVGALKFFVIEGKSSMIYVGPWGSLGYFKGAGSSSVRDLQVGGELGWGW